MIFRILSTRLYLIEILHQTTTLDTANELVRKLYLIEILHQTTTTRHLCFRITSCILSKFYIKPQHAESAKSVCVGCILSKFYIKPQPMARVSVISNVVSYRNSTSNHNSAIDDNIVFIVVSYRNSTSNHNQMLTDIAGRVVVSYRNSTSNHNSTFDVAFCGPLYLIEILHQTTTACETPQA